MSDIKKLYMAGICWFITALIVIFVAPGKLWIEAGALFFLWLGTWWVGSFFTNRRKQAGWVATLSIGLLLLERFGILNWIWFGVWLTGIGILIIMT